MREEIIRSARLILGDCREVLPTLPDASFAACVTDPPYELGFMGKGWDRTGIANDTDMWREVFRVLKPGAHLAAFGGTRTFHRMACAIEDAGFEIRDTLMWLYGSGFPKSLDVSKAIDKAAGAKRKVIGKHPNPASNAVLNWGNEGADNWRENYDRDRCVITAPATPEAARWAGWGTALKPAWEIHKEPHAAGRWPANVLHDGSPEVEAAFAAFGERGSFVTSRSTQKQHSPTSYGLSGGVGERVGFGDTGTASRFFFTAKADASDRAGSKHPTVKPTALMRWLIQLITPKGGMVLDPFAGSGSTGLAADQLGFSATLIEQDAEYFADMQRKIAADAPLFSRHDLITPYDRDMRDLFAEPRE